MNGNGLAHCDACREYHRSYKARLKVQRIQTSEGVAKELAQFRRELSRLRATVKNMANRYRMAYHKGYTAGLAGKRARFRRMVSKYELPGMSQQEAASISHRFDRSA